jgi:hypothetical protein
VALAALSEAFVVAVVAEADIDDAEDEAAAAEAAAAASERAAAFLLSSIADMLLGATGVTSVFSGVTPVPL